MNILLSPAGLTSCSNPKVQCLGLTAFYQTAIRFGEQTPSASTKSFWSRLQQVVTNWTQSLPMESRNAATLMEAVQQGDSQKVEQLLRCHVSLNEPGYEGRTALMVACMLGNEAIVNKLIQAKANINQTDDLGQTALMFAAERGFLNIVQALIQAKAEVDFTQYHGKTPLIEAAEAGAWKVVVYLLSQGAKINTQDHLGQTALIGAVKNGRLKTIRYLLTQGADILATDEKGRSVFEHAIQNVRPAVLPYLFTALHKRFQNPTQVVNFLHQLRNRFSQFLPSEWHPSYSLLITSIKNASHFFPHYVEKPSSIKMETPPTEEANQEAEPCFPVDGTFDEPVRKIFQTLYQMVPSQGSLTWQLPVPTDPKRHTHVLKISAGQEGSPPCLYIRYWDIESDENTKITQTFKIDIQKQAYTRHGVILVRGIPFLLPQHSKLFGDLPQKHLNPLFRIVEDLYRCLSIENDETHSAGKKGTPSERFGPLVTTQTLSPSTGEQEQTQELRQGLTFVQLVLWKQISEIFEEWNEQKEKGLTMYQRLQQEIDSLQAKKKPLGSVASGSAPKEAIPAFYR